ncbi:MAG: 50S ribosomal protein L13 [Clostridiales bacterium]|nr:50S ribosomal protein L13 [Clostridiales bacterium]MDD2571981.1 50S ribosomal protein L13 [Eubacteriales bacterium]MDY0119652.1 50S ribosomal protein L13 [Clostridia bacterium]NLG29561.1 50S ribosomal protein L13 [Clostridiaceae bacterium]MCK9349732.1 50S ribosomal protein L13 [Clostridiales bacterium]
MKTYMPKASDVKRDWYLVDAEGQVLGRLATEIAAILRGKNKPEFTPHMDMGDFVVVVNADKIVVTGKKEQQKLYRRHTGYPGGLREVPFERMMEKHPERVLEKAIRGMLPKNTLGRQMYRKLKVYAGPHHKHEAQQPIKIEL